MDLYGSLLIFRIHQDLTPRTSTVVDEHTLTQTFGLLKFEVTVENDVTRDEFEISLLKSLQTFSNPIYVGPFVLCILTHGDATGGFCSHCHRFTASLYIETTLTS